jgi:hypothetical protein
MPDPIRTRGITTRTAPALQRGHHANGKGDTSTRTGGAPSQPPPFNTMPHHLTAPTIRNAPTHHHDKGGSGQRIPHRTNTTDTRATAHHAPGNDTVRDTSRSTDEYCGGMSRARAAPLDWSGLAQHVSQPFHSSAHRGGWTPSTHPLSHCSRSHDQRTINEQRTTIVVH